MAGDDLTADQVRRILEVRCNGKWDTELDRVVEAFGRFRKGGEEMTRQIRKQELDFSTVMEIANQINAKSLDSHGIESYIGYIVSTTRGKFAVSKVFLLRQSELESSRVVYIPPRTDQPQFEFDSGGPFGKKIREVGTPFFLVDLDPQEWKYQELDFLRSNDLELCIPLIRRDPQLGADLKGLLCLGKRFTKQAYTPSELKFIGLLSDMIAISLHNAQLHRRSIVDSSRKFVVRSRWLETVLR